MYKLTSPFPRAPSFLDSLYSVWSELKGMNKEIPKPRIEALRAELEQRLINPPNETGFVGVPFDHPFAVILGKGNFIDFSKLRTYNNAYLMKKEFVQFMCELASTVVSVLSDKDFEDVLLMYNITLKL